MIAAGFPSKHVHLGHRLVDLADREDRVEARFDNGARIAVDVLVGADGIHSTVRARLFGEEEPEFAGCVAYRGLVPVERIADLGLECGNQSWVGPGGHFVHCCVSRGRLLISSAGPSTTPGTARTGPTAPPVARALAAFEGWPAGPPHHRRRRDLLHLGLVRPRPAAAMVGGPHYAARRCVPPDVPVHGAGRGTGDRGRRRARRLSAARDRTTRPLHCERYERLRLPRVTRLQQMSRANKLRFHMCDGPEQEARDAAHGPGPVIDLPRCCDGSTATTLPGTRERDGQGEGVLV